MTLNQFAAEKRSSIHDNLLHGLEPPEGAYDAAVLRAAKVKEPPQMGTTRYEPNAIHFEFIYPDSKSSPTVLTVTLEPPERIVFLPVPDWVVENIWQGSIAGTHHFESEAQRLVDEFKADLMPGPNGKWFEPRAPKRRE